MMTTQTRFAVCVQTLVLMNLTRQIKPNVPRALKCLDEACRIPSRYYRDSDVPAEAQTFVEYWMRGAKKNERPAWLSRWIKERRPER